jgi:hypothetical protein
MHQFGPERIATTTPQLAYKLFSLKVMDGAGFYGTTLRIPNEVPSQRRFFVEGGSRAER